MQSYHQLKLFDRLLELLIAADMYTIQLTIARKLHSSKEYPTSSQRLPPKTFKPNHNSFALRHQESRKVSVVGQRRVYGTRVGSDTWRMKRMNEHLVGSQS